MDCLPIEILHTMLEYITECRDIAGCMRVCSQWYNSIKYLNGKYSQDFTRSGYKLIPKLIMQCKLIRANKHMLRAMLKEHNDGQKVLRIMFTNDYPGVLLRCASAVERCIEGELRVTLGIAVIVSIETDKSTGAHLKVSFGDITAHLYKKCVEYTAYKRVFSNYTRIRGIEIDNMFIERLKEVGISDIEYFTEKVYTVINKYI